MLETLFGWMGNYMKNVTEGNKWWTQFLSKNADETEKRTGYSLKPSWLVGMDPGNFEFGNMFKSLSDGLSAASEAVSTDTQGKAATPNSRGGGGRAVQDFRFSRFDISQKFEEGMNPDQIAVAFSKDLGKIGEQRLTSGFEPLFSVY
jgi:hypothetical protein